MLELTAVVNGVVVALFGVLMGFVSYVVWLLAPADLRHQQPGERREGESWAGYWLRESRDQAEVSRGAIEAGPKSYRLAVFAFTGLIAMLLVVLVVSPVHMDWLVLLLSVVIGCAMAALLYRLGRAGRLRA